MLAGGDETGPCQSPAIGFQRRSRKLTSAAINETAAAMISAPTADIEVGAVKGLVGS